MAMLKKDFDGWLEFLEKVEKADKSGAAKLYAERVKMWIRKIEDAVFPAPENDLIFALVALTKIIEAMKKINPTATKLAEDLEKDIQCNFSSDTLQDMSEAASRTYAEVMKRK